MAWNVKNEMPSGSIQASNLNVPEVRSPKSKVSSMKNAYLKAASPKTLKATPNAVVQRAQVQAVCESACQGRG